MQYVYHHSVSYTSIRSHNIHFSFVVGTIKMQSLSNFVVYNTVLLTIITMLCISPLRVYWFPVCPLKQYIPQPREPPVYSISHF